MQKDTRANSEGESPFGKFFIKGQFSWSLSFFWPIILFCLPWLFCLRTLLVGAHAPLSQDGSWREGVWEKQESPWPGVSPWLLTPKETFCTCVVSPSPRGGGSGDPLILYSNKALLLLVLAMTVILVLAMTLILRHPQEEKLGYLPCLCHYFHFGEQSGG